MKLYSCKVRLNGSLYNEVPKSDVTAAEIHILKMLHGDDAVIGVEETGKNKATQAEERDRLEAIYGEGIVAQQLAKTPELALAAVFGINGRLPDDIPGAPKAQAVKTTKPAEDEPSLKEEDAMEA